MKILYTFSGHYKPMFSALFKKINLLFLIGFYANCFYSQHYTYKLQKGDYYCEKGSANIAITGLDKLKDSIVYIHWSTGENNVYNVTELNEGEHSVNIRVKHKDSIGVNRDTTIYFRIERSECKVSFGNYFSPNDDGINDFFTISGTIAYYPNFELQVFSKWGQKVHSQKGTYEPWDGTWNGVKLPDGTYYYVFFYDSTKRHKIEKGDITIIR